jgi:phosphatidylinositol dimannoside acyltransferase
VNSVASNSLDSAQDLAEQWEPDPSARVPPSHEAASGWINALVWSLRHHPWLPRAVRPVAPWCAWHVSRSLRTNLMLNARRILGEDSPAAQRRALGRGVLANFMGFITEIARAPAQSDEQLAARLAGVVGIDAYHRGRALGRGAVLVTAHLGAFEIGMFALRQHEPRVHVVFRRDAMRGFDQLRTDLRQRLGVIEAPVDDGLAGWIRLRDALRRDEVVVVQGDRVMPGQRGQALPFMGGHMLFPTGPVKLALATGAPIVPIFAPRDPAGRVRIFMEEPIFLDPDDRSPAVIDDVMRRIARAIEAQVRAHPEQWLTLHRAWCEDALGMPRKRKRDLEQAG